MKPHARIRILCCAAAATLAAARPAAADVTGQATLGPENIQLLDLRPEDGMAPGISFAPSGTEASVTAALQSTAEEKRWLRTGGWQATGVDVAAGGVAARAEISGGAAGTPQGLTMRLDGALHDVMYPGAGTTSFSAVAALLGNGAMVPFTLAPWTSVSFSVDVNALLRTDHAGESVDFMAEMRLDTVAPWHGDRVDTVWLQCAGACTLADTRKLGVTFANESDSSLAGYWSFYGTLDGASVAAVPEPATAMMWMAGAAVLGRLASRRTRSGRREGLARA